MRQKGFIRFVIGMLVMFGGVGGVENAKTNLELLYATLISLAGILIATWGVMYMKPRKPRK